MKGLKREKKVHTESKKAGNFLEDKLGGLRESEECPAGYVAVTIHAISCRKNLRDVHSMLNSSFECEVAQQPYTSRQIVPVILHTLLCSALGMCLAS